MARRLARTQPASAPVEGFEVELARVGAMSIDQLRATWRRVFASDPPPAFSRDLLARAIAFRTQEKALGGLHAPTARLLRSLIKPGVDPTPHCALSTKHAESRVRRRRNAKRPKKPK
jgi:hypothetical protein